MGLDSVELVIAVEEKFGISVTDAEAISCTTPGKLIALVRAKLQLSEERICLSQRAFHLLRKSATKTFGITRKSVGLETDVRRLLNGRSEAEAWAALKSDLQARSWPSLVRPAWLKWNMALAVIAIFSGAQWWLGGLIAFIAAVSFLILAVKGTRKFESRIPKSAATFRALVPFAMTSNLVSWPPDLVAEAVRQIVIEQLGLKPELYREDADFIHDLGMD